jgi:predicted DNA-binding protein (UPF0251 family)
MKMMRPATTLARLMWGHTHAMDQFSDPMVPPSQVQVEELCAMELMPALALVKTLNLKIMVAAENMHVLKTLALSKSKITLALVENHAI